MKVLVYGDSLASSLSGLGDSPPEDWLQTHIECLPGWTAREMLVQEQNGVGLSFLLSEDKYDALVLFAGTNDLGQGATTDETLERLAVLLQLAQSQSRLVILMSIPLDRLLNRRLATSLTANRILFCRFFDLLDDGSVRQTITTDGLHLNDKGRQMCCQAVRSMLT